MRIDVTERERGTYLRADIRGARGFSSGGETHWTLGKAKAYRRAAEDNRRRPPPSPGTNEIVLPPRRLPPPRLFSTPEMLSFSPSSRRLAVFGGFPGDRGKASPAPVVSENLFVTRATHERVCSAKTRRRRSRDRARFRFLFGKSIAKKILNIFQNNISNIGISNVFLIINT